MAKNKNVSKQQKKKNTCRNEQYQNDPIFREKAKTKSKIYYWKHREENLKKSKQYQKVHQKELKAKRHAHYEANKLKILAQIKAYRERDPERYADQQHQKYLGNRSYYLKKQRRYYKKNKDKVREYEVNRYWANPEKSRADRREYRERNIVEIRKKDRKRARIRNSDPKWRAHYREYHKKRRGEVRISLRQRMEDIKRVFGAKCWNCGLSESLDVLEFDHKKRVPKNRRGKKRTNKERSLYALKHVDDVQLLCANCHAIKTGTEKLSPGFTESSEEYWVRRLGLILEFGACCAECGYDKNVLALEFDHVHGLGNRKRSTAVHEVPKYPGEFQLLCANCHTLKTLIDLRKRKKIAV